MTQSFMASGIAPSCMSKELMWTSIACNLADDIASFPDGDQSMVGSKGITLSGGQKARLVRE